MVGNTEDDDDSGTVALEDLSEDRAELEAKVKELRDCMLAKYVKIGDTFVRRDARSVTITTPTKIKVREDQVIPSVEDLGGRTYYGTGSGGGVEETLKAIMKRLDTMEEKLLPIQDLEERMAIMEILCRPHPGSHGRPASGAPVPKAGHNLGDGSGNPCLSDSGNEADQRDHSPRSRVSKHNQGSKRSHQSDSDDDNDEQRNFPPRNRGNRRQNLRQNKEEGENQGRKTVPTTHKLEFPKYDGTSDPLPPAVAQSV
ncbi:hypothetical protein GUJ93_ZPchr0006g44479 [Zizania palustris]|uniref:Uncharacterized protein n=1 Tax=Zizania palustris TaxID=103762 RepID=A0A8J5TB58_ZIZPA|nr:hypothetical protein GUJ93_ZPchr0006g44479 [Zizania palustris]